MWIADMTMEIVMIFLPSNDPDCHVKLPGNIGNGHCDEDFNGVIQIDFFGEPSFPQIIHIINSG
jgi:hypothetical protein